MQITLTAVDIGLALVQSDPSDLMVLLATVADHDLHHQGEVIAAVSDRHNGTAYHDLVAPFLRQLADAIEGRRPADAA